MRKIALLLALTLALCPLYAALGESAVAVEEVRTENGESYVAYPLLAGMENTALQSKINDDVVISSDASRHLLTLVGSGAGAGTIGLRVDYEACLQGDIYSVVISAKGKQPNGRSGHTYTALTYDLQTGERIALDSLFTDVDGAVAYMEECVVASLGDELSGYYENGELTPLPVDSFTVDADGVTFWYPYAQFSYLSEYSGACQFGYAELADYLRDDEAGVPARIGALPQALTAAQSKAAIGEAAQAGALPHVPVTLGESMTDVIAKHRLLRTPDEYPGGRYFSLEAPKLRDILVISDTMESGWERSVVEGIRAERGELGGLVVGRATRDDWRAILGEPTELITLSESMAYDYNLPAGQCDLYDIGGRQLRLYADADGILRCIQLDQ